MYCILHSGSALRTPETHLAPRRGPLPPCPLSQQLLFSNYYALLDVD